MNLTLSSFRPDTPNSAITDFAPTKSSALHADRGARVLSHARFLVEKPLFLITAFVEHRIKWHPTESMGDPIRDQAGAGDVLVIR